MVGWPRPRGTPESVGDCRSGVERRSTTACASRASVPVPYWPCRDLAHAGVTAMDERHHLAESRQIEAQAHELAEMIDRAVELMRVLTALRLRWETLQAAASEFVAAAGQRSPATPPPVPSMSGAGGAVHTGRPPEPVPARNPRPAPFIPADGPPAGPPNYSEDTGRDEVGEADRAELARAAPPHPITLTIESPDGPLD